MKKTVLFLLVGMLGFACLSYGVVAAFLQELKDGQGYTVPAGKTLKVEHMSFTASGEILFEYGSTTTSVSTVYFGSTTTGDAKFPFLMPSGMTIRPALFTTNDYIVLFGRLVDDSDLFAGLEHEIDSIENVAMVSWLGLATKTTRPALFKVESAEDPLGEWTTELNASVAPQGNPKNYLAKIPAPNNKRVYRTRARLKDL